MRLNALKDRQSQDKETEVKTPTLQDTVGRTPPPDPKAEDWASKKRMVWQRQRHDLHGF